MKKTGLYIRVSTELQEKEGYSIEAQTEKLQAYCVAMGFTEHELYVDGGWSGSNINRPEMQRLISDIKKSKIDRVIVYKLDRLSRSQKDTLYLIEDTFIPHGVDFISLKESLDTSTPLGRLMIGILSAFAQLERENIKERMQMGNIQRVKNGYWKGGGCVPFGYDYNKTLGYLIKNKDAEKIVHMHDLYQKGHSCKKIASLLGVKHETQIRDCLMRITYTGNFKYCGQIYQSKNEPIISMDTYERTMQIMRQRSNTIERGTNLLTGIIYCGKCGARMRYKKNRSTNFNCIQCNSVSKDKPYLIKDPNCKNRSVSIEKTEAAIIKDLFSITTTESKDSYIKPTGETVLNILTKQYDETNKQLKKLYALYSKAEDDILLETIKDVKYNLSNLHQQITEEEIQTEIICQTVEHTTALKTIKAAWEYMTPHEQREMLRAIIEKIIITDGKIEIHYQFKQK